MNWQRLFRRNTDNDSRFSNSEIIMILAVIAILIGLVVVQFNTHQARQRDNQRRGGISLIQQQVTLYYATHSYYPVSIQQLSGLSDKTCRDPKGHGNCRNPDYHYKAFSSGQAVLPTNSTSCDNLRSFCVNYVLYSERMEKADNPYFVRSY